MIADDVTYFEEIRSPILRYARRFPSGNETRTVFESAFPEYAKLRPQFLLPARELANRVAEELLGEPQAVIPLLEGFAGPDASALLTQFDTVQFETGENIFSQGDHSAGMFVVLDGQVEIVRSGGHTDHVVAVMSRGDTFGEMGFLSDAPRSAGARASDRTRLLVLSTAEFERLSIVNPKLALHLLTNMFRLAALRFNEVVVTRSELWLRLERSTHKNI